MAEEETKEEVKSESKLKSIILVAVLAIVLAGAGFGGYKFFLSAPKDPFAEAGKGQDGIDDVPPISIPLSDFVVNLAAPDEDTFLKVDLSLAVQISDEGKKARLQKEVSERTDQLKDIVNMVLTSKRRDELEGIRGKENLKAELVRKINVVLSEGEISTIYFREFTFQVL